MRNILFISSSLMQESKSHQVAEELIGALTAGGGGSKVVERNLQPHTMPHLSMVTLSALGTTADQHSAEQVLAMKFADTLIEEVEAADTLVLATPMYNFSVPSVLKAWLDHIARAGRTFRYTANGPQGLLKDKKVYVVVSRGGYYGSESPAQALNFQEPYLRAFFAFLGITDVSFIAVEGQAVSPEAASQGLAAARAAIPTVLAQAA